MSTRINFRLEVPNSEGEQDSGFVELLDESIDASVQEPSIWSSWLYLANVPAHMIPIDILSFVGADLKEIAAIRVFKHANGLEPSYFAVIEAMSNEAANALLEGYDGQSMSSLQKVVCELRRIKKVVYAMKDTCKDAVQQDAEDAVHCPVCLEPIATEKPMSTTTCCNHRFHTQCALRFESSQCPVCRFQHDCDGMEAPTCFECGTQALGVTATSNPGAFASGLHLGGHRADLWLCLICGYTGCGLRYGGHIQRHYEDTLHTYAQNTDSRQVWDFAGDGYVHRLILTDSASAQAALDSSHAEAGQPVQPPTKLVESHGAHPAAGWRDRRPPLSSDQEEALVSGKLETAARHYNQLLAWQLEQNRLLYQARLQRIRESIGGQVEGGGQLGKPGEHAPAGGKQLCGANWRENMISTLRTEKGKMEKQLDSARSRLERTRKEVAVLQELHSSLETNKQVWQQRVDSAVGVLDQARQAFQQELPLLDEKVRTLMERLDMAPKTATGVRAPQEGKGVGGDS